MKILVAGGAGFIGHTVVRQLEDQGHDCAILDNHTTYGILDQEQHQQLIAERLEGLSAQVYPVDIENSTAVNRVFANFRPDTVIHLASFPRAKVVNTNPSWGRGVMINGTENLLQAASKHSISRFVYISSSMIYGDFDSGVRESAPKNPGSLYATYKLAGEQLTKYYAERYGFEYSVVRPSAVYGPRDVEDRVVAKFFARAMNNGTLYVNGETEALDFSFVEDVAKGIVLCATHPAAAGEAFNITRGEEDTIQRAANLVRTIVGSGTVSVRDRDPLMPSRGFLSVNKAAARLGYEPTINIEQGFSIYYDWLKNR